VLLVTNVESRLPDHFFRHEAGRLVARLTRQFGASELSLVEDAVQTAFERAVTARGPAPDNLSAWLYRTARNALLDELRKKKRLEFDEQAGHAMSSEPPESAFPGEIQSDELRLLFVCADERLSENTRLVLALKLLSGLSTSEISARLFLSEANVQKLLERGRARLAELWADAASDDYLSPTNASLRARLASVLEMLHLLFTSGHSSLTDEHLIRRELCDEALRLAQNLASHEVGDRDETWALLAVFHLHLARFEARLQGEKSLLLLDEQDRTLWDRDQIELGFHCLYRAAEGGTVSSFHAEAAILAEHCSARSFAETRWDEIVMLYELWETLEPSPLVTLNRAIALAEWKGPERGLELLAQMTPPSWLVRYYLWDATFAELSRRAGRFEAAIRLGKAAMASAPTAAERAIFARRVERAEAQDRGR
jgi:RNA polymerase sigma factor (sigma-70 family)